MESIIRILLVEDVETDAELLFKEITRNNIQFTKHIVDTEADYLEALRSFNPDLIISDYSLPQFNGMLALKQREEYFPDIPFILVTGSINEETAVECMKAGADDYVIKQNLKRLAPAIRSAISKKETIHSKKRAEESLVKSEAVTRMIIELSPIGILNLDKEGIITYENNAMKKMMGVPEGLDSPILGKNFFKLPIGETLGNQVLNKLRTNVPIYGETIYYHSVMDKDIYAEIFSTPITNSLGNFNGIIVMLKDITANVQVQTQLKERTQKLNTIINNLHGVIYQCKNDKTWTNIYMNNGIQELSGYPNEDFINNKVRSYNSIIFPDDQEMVWNVIQESVAEKKSYTIEYRIITASGKRKWVWEKGHGIFEGNELITLEGFITDITERKEYELLIKKQSEVIEQSPVATIITDSNGRIEFVNTHFTNLTQYSLHDVAGKKPRIFNPGHCPESAYNLMWKTLQEGEVWKTEFYNRRKDKSKYWEDVTISTLTDSNGNISNYILLTDDISEKKKMMDDLLSAKSKAEESDKLKTSFLQNISHEIRTPMNSIVGFSEILNNQNLTEEKRKYYTTIIQQSSNQLLAVITDIVIISTIESGQEKIRERETNVNLIFKSLQEQFESKAKQLNIDLISKATLSEINATILTDDTKLIQILTNLIGNALKFTKQGFVEYGYTLKDNFLEFFVKDTGIGIPEEMHERIFDRFRQASATIALDYGGTGLGLSISKAYVELLGGKIRVESQPNKGSEFLFTIPYKKTASEPENNAIEEVLETERIKTILVAEDEDNNYKLISELLSTFNIKLIRATNGIDAVEICKSNQTIDLVVMDIKMPIMNGFEATKIIKEIRPELKVIAQTAYSFDNDKTQAFISGCDDFIAKPFTKKQFIGIITKYLS